MSTLKVNTINAATSGQGVAVDIQNPKTFRNLVINGAMQVAQRGTTSTTAGKSTVDMFRTHVNDADNALTQAQIALTSSDTGPWEKGFRYAFQHTNASQTSGAEAEDFAEFETRLEAQNVANSGWNYTSASSYVTLSFWVKASVAQNYYGYIRSHDGTGQIYSFETGALTANTWTKITKTIPGHANIQIDSNNGQGLKLFWTQYTGTDRTSNVTLNTWAAYGSGVDKTPDQPTGWWTTNGATYAITGVQLEVGEVATDFEHRPFGDELAKCQRYFCKTYNQGVNPGTATDTGSIWGRNYSAANKTTNTAIFTFPVPMRENPTTITAYSVTGTAGQCSTGAGNPQDSNTNIGFNACKVQSQKGWGGLTTDTAVTSDKWIGGHFTVSADL